jgi:hypothetical protein
MGARPSYEEAVARQSVLEILAAFDARVVGTPPLGLDMPDSDIDLVCHAPDPVAFADHLWKAFGPERDFRIRQWVSDGRPVIASFHAHGWLFEIFGAVEPVERQPGWRHFAIERRLLDLASPGFREALLALRKEGAKTEPAFAALLGLEGNPYQTLLVLEGWGDSELIQLFEHAGPYRTQP